MSSWWWRSCGVDPNYIWEIHGNSSHFVFYQSLWFSSCTFFGHDTGWVTVSFQRLKGTLPLMENNWVSRGSCWMRQGWFREFPKIRVYPKMDGENNAKPYWNGMIWGETHYFRKHPFRELRSCPTSIHGNLKCHSEPEGMVSTMPAKLVQQDENCQKIVWDDAYTPPENYITFSWLENPSFEGVCPGSFQKRCQHHIIDPIPVITSFLHQKDSQVPRYLNQILQERAVNQWSLFKHDNVNLFLYHIPYIFIL